jgi:hypothetical protein
MLFFFFIMRHLYFDTMLKVCVMIGRIIIITTNYYYLFCTLKPTRTIIFM